MNPVLNRTLGLLIALISPYPMPAAPVDTEAQTIRITEKTGPMFAWVRHGALFLHVDGSLKKEQFLYRDRNQKVTIVSGDLVKTSQMIREEIDDYQELVAFLKTTLAEIIFTFMAQRREYRITEGYINMREVLPPYVWRELYDPEKISASLEILRKYGTDAAPTIEKERWRLEFHMQLPDGSIERWNLNGPMRPFEIDHLEKTTVEKAGSVIPLPEAPRG